MKKTKQALRMKHEQTGREMTIEVSDNFETREAAAAHAEKVCPGFKVIDDEKPAPATPAAKK